MRRRGNRVFCIIPTLAVAVLGFVVNPLVASASQPIALNVKLRPERLGQGTTVSLSFQIPHSGNQIPSPLSTFDVLLPAEMGLGSSTLGLDTCSSETLVGNGPSSCPSDAQMGIGSAVAEASLGSQVVSESAPVSIFMAKESGGETTLLAYFAGNRPVIAPLVFPSQFTASGNSPRSEFKLAVPAIPGLPETPDTAIVRMHLTIGPEGLTYYRFVHKKRQAYKPQGMNVPVSCPKGGFPFATYFKFQDGTEIREVKDVPCPRA